MWPCIHLHSSRILYVFWEYYIRIYTLTHSSWTLQFLDVYPPNSNFSRKNCDARAGIVSMIGSARQDPPSETEVVTCVEKSEGTLVRFAGVEHGDIGLYSFLKTQLRDIH